MNYPILFKKGFQKFSIEKKNLKYLKIIKDLVIANSTKILKYKANLEKIHEYDFSNTDFNDFRLANFNLLNSDKNLHKNLFLLYKDILFDLLGHDISVQKKVNFAIQRPFDQNRAPFHKDSPPNSPYELVVWLPLVDCTNTMSMYFFDLKKSKSINKYLALNKRGNQDSFSKKNGNLCDCKFGEFFIFLSPTYHYIPINLEKNTRWSFNLRYKNTFTPYGSKGYLDFFKPISYSEITNSVFENTFS